MATVFLAEDLKHHRSVAIKVLHSELTAALGAGRFLREIEIAARLQHPHILPLYDSGAAAGFLYYVMPYVEGESLRDRMTREKQLPQDDALRIATEVAGALAYAHSRGVVHRDIKPENIMLSGGTAVVADFGIAHAVTAAGDAQHLTQTGTVIGTPAYMSPEQATGSTEIDGRSDQYSLACVVYEMLVGEPPFTGPTAQAVIARHSLDMVSPPSIVRSTIPDAVEAAILRALAKLPVDRQVPTLTVVSKNGVGLYRSSAVRLDSVARALNVGTMVAGNVDEVGGRYRVSVNLIDGASGADLGTRASFEQPVGAVLAIRDSLARKVVEFLRVRLGEELRLREERAGTRSVAAGSLVQQGERNRKRAEARLQKDDVDGAFAAFARADSQLALAEAADPEWVDVTVQRGLIAYRRARLTSDRKTAAPWLDVALGHAERALRMSPGYPRALELRGTARYTKWLLELSADPAEQAKLLTGARQDLEAATQADPSLAGAFSTLSHLYYQTEDVAAAVLAARKAYEEDAYLTVATEVLWRLFIGSYDLEQFAQAKRWCQEGAARFPRYYRFAECKLWLMTTDAAEPNVPEAWRLYGEVDTLAPAARKPYQMHQAAMIVGAVLARKGLADSARHVLVAARADSRVDPKQELLPVEAFARTLLGEQGQAIELLKQYVAANPAHMFKRGGDISW